MQVLQPADRQCDGGRIATGGANDLLSAFRKLRGEFNPGVATSRLSATAVIGLDPSANREPGCQRGHGKALAARTELGAQLHAGGISRGENIMMTGHRTLLAALTCAGIVITAFGALADDVTDAKSPEEIGRQLKSRGLPLLDTAPGELNPAASSAGVKAVPLVPQPPKPGTVQAVPLVPDAPKSRGVPPTAERPQPTPAAHPSVALEAITFEPGSAKLKPGSIQELRNRGVALSRILKDGPKLLIEGHTDKKGTAAYNLDLSERRADAVKDYLVKAMGVPADRLETVGKGFSEPADPGNPNALENRRVVVVNLGAS
jgi:outer membrane protein OmpA-like peptidoglycan-associated protein